MKFLFIWIAVFCIFLQIISAEDYFDELTLDAWEDYKSTFGKSYDTEFEEQYRMNILRRTRQKIARHNYKYEQGEVSYEMGINQFSDLLYSEFIEQFTLGDNFV